MLVEFYDDDVVVVDGDEAVNAKSRTIVDADARWCKFQRQTPNIKQRTADNACVRSNKITMEQKAPSGTYLLPQTTWLDYFQYSTK